MKARASHGRHDGAPVFKIGRIVFLVAVLIGAAARVVAGPGTTRPATTAPSATAQGDPASAGAASPGPLSEDVLRTVDLSAADRALAENLLAPTSGTPPSSATQRQLRGLVRSLVDTASWKAALLAEAWGPALSEEPDANAAATAAQLLHAVGTLEKGQKKCAARLLFLAERATTWATSGDLDSKGKPAPVPVFTSADADSTKDPCLSTGSVPSRGQALLTIPARRGQEVVLQILAPTFRWLDHLPRVALDQVPGRLVEGRPQAGGWVIFFAAVPRDARVLVMVRPDPSTAEKRDTESVIPSVRMVRARSDNELLPDRPACLDVSRLGHDGGSIFVNGRRLGPGTETVTLLRADEGATVHVLGRPDEARPRFVREISGARLVGRETCTVLEGDATMSSRKTVLVSTTAGAGCTEAGIDPLKLRAEIERLLPKETYETSGANLADLLKIVDGFQASLKALGSGPLSDQAFDTTADIARGLRDVGFSIALTVDLRCIAEPGREIQFTVVAQRIDLDAVAEAARKESRKDRVESMNHVLSSQIETQQGTETLRGLLGAAVSRLFDLPYLRLTTGSGADWQRPNVKLAFEGWVDGQAGVHWTAKLEARKIDDSDTQALVQCHDVSEENVVRRAGASAAPTLGKRHWVEQTDVTLKAASGAAPAAKAPTSLSRAEFVLPFFPVEPGLYAVHASLAPPSTQQPSEAPEGASSSGATDVRVDVCARIEESPYAFWTQLTHLEGLLGHRRAWPDVRSTTTYMLFGAQRYASETRTVSALVGLGYSFFEAPAPAGWSDLARSRETPGTVTDGPALVFDASGNSPLKWTRLSLAASLQFEWRLIRLADVTGNAWWRGYIQRSWARTSAFFVTFAPLIDLGWYIADGVPPDLRLNVAHPFDVDGSFLGGLSYRVLLSDHQILSLNVGVGWLGFDDLGSSDARRRSQITYDNFFAWSFGVGFGWSP